MPSDTDPEIIALAVEVAEKVMGWPAFDKAADAYPCVGISKFDATIWVFAAEFGVDAMWSPWNEIKDWWQIVDRMSEQGRIFSLRQNRRKDGTITWTANFAVPMGDDQSWTPGTGDTPGLAVMRAAVEFERWGRERP